MTFLPIVQRELRVAARRRNTFAVRLMMAAAAVLLGASVFIVTLASAPGKEGKYIFQGLAGLALLYCLVHGRRSTADCLSEEKREGTLGLLFLTDLKGHDVILGKLTATSLNGFYGLLAVVPVLALPLLLGGTSNAEFWRVVLVLMDTFLLSLAIGMFGSALSRDYHRAMGANFFLFFLLIMVPPAFGAAVAYFSPTNAFVPELFYSCPVYAFILCFDTMYMGASAHFWCSVATIHGLTWLLLLLSSRVIPHAWQDQPVRAANPGWGELWRALSYGSTEKQQAFRRSALNINAFYWLAARARLKPAHVRIFLGLMALWWIVGWISSGAFWFDEAAHITTTLLLNSTLKLWILLEAGQRLAQDKKSGAMELLLTTSIRSRDILRGQLLALRRQFFWPLLVVVVVELIFMSMLLPTSQDASTLAMWMAGLVMLVADVFALSWVSMFMALTSKSQNRANIKTVGWVLVLPWFIGIIIIGVTKLWYEFVLAQTWSPGWKLNLGLWFGLGLLADAGFGFWAWKQLRTRFRRFAMERFELAPEQSKVPRRVAKPTRDTPKTGHRRQVGWRQSKAVRIAALCLAIVLGFAWFRIWMQPKYPPPLTVAIQQNRGAVRVFSSVNGFAIVLPDGSLWLWGQRAGGSPAALQRFATRGATPGLWLPEQMGTNYDWAQACAGFSHGAGIRSDGTLWQWGTIGQAVSTTLLRQVGVGRDWVAVSAGSRYSVVLRRDGTLWAWGENSVGQLGNGPGTNQNLVQVGTNNDWAAASCHWAGTFAIRSNGTLWAWGGVPSFSGGGTVMNRIPTPTQLCEETNWSGFSMGFWMLVRNRAGELWDPLYGTPNAGAPVASIGHPVITNSTADHVAMAFCGRSQLFEVRPDGTLWCRDQSFGPYPRGPTGNWRQVGKRTDWVGIWSSGGTALGLTLDGTLWTWGYDRSSEPVLDILTRLKLAQARLRSRFGTTPGGMMGAPVAFQKEPRPLMRLTSDRNME